MTTTVPTRVLALAQALARGASRERGVRFRLLEHVRRRPNALWTSPRLAQITGLRVLRLQRG